jgi:hypothetical protein
LSVADIEPLMRSGANGHLKPPPGGPNHDVTPIARRG